MENNELIILVHGFNKNQTDMFALKNHLIEMGYQCITVNLPTRFGSLNDCTIAMENQTEKLIKGIECKKIHFVGHSMGGLIIRSFLARNYIPNIGRCVFIACPSRGAPLADIVNKLFKPALKIYKPLNDLKTNNLRISSPKNTPYPEMGVIAGNKNNLLLGILLKKENDGRVEINSTKFELMTDFISQPYGHKEIHHKQDIARLVDEFLSKGSFTNNGEG